MYLYLGYTASHLPSPEMAALALSTDFGTWTIFWITKSRNAFSDALFLAAILEVPA